MKKQNNLLLTTETYLEKKISFWRFKITIYLSKKEVNSGLVKLSKETGIPLVATNDVHYVNKEDSKIHDVLMCIQMGKTLNDPNRMRFGSDEFYLKSREEMENYFHMH